MTPKYKISVNYFRLHPELLDELIEKLDEQMNGTNEYNLKYSDSSIIILRELVREWLEKYGKHLTLRRV